MSLSQKILAVLSRLPYGQRRSIAGGYLLVFITLQAIGMFFIGVFAVFAHPAVVIGGLYIAPLAVLPAFVAGAITWRYLLPQTPKPRHGTFAALIAIAGAYLLLQLGLLAGWIGYQTLWLGQSPQLWPFHYVGLATFLLSGWATFPLAGVWGWLWVKSNVSTDVARTQG